MGRQKAWSLALITTHLCHRHNRAGLNVCQALFKAFEGVHVRQSDAAVLVFVVFFRGAAGGSEDKRGFPRPTRVTTQICHAYAGKRTLPAGSGHDGSMPTATSLARVV